MPGAVVQRQASLLSHVVQNLYAVAVYPASHEQQSVLWITLIYVLDDCEFLLCS